MSRQSKQTTAGTAVRSLSLSIDDAMPGARVKPARSYSEIVQIGSGIHVEIKHEQWPVVESAQKQNTDPRTPEGAAWLTNEYEKIYAKVKDPASKPPRDVLKRIINGNLKPVAERSGSEVYWEHILLRYCGDCTSTGGENYLELDITRNYSTALNFAITGDLCFSAKGINAIRVSAAWLNYWLATTEYDVYDTLLRDMGDGITHATENWHYVDPVIKKIQVKDGFDWFEIKNGLITDMMIRYTIEQYIEARK